MPEESTKPVVLLGVGHSQKDGGAAVAVSTLLKAGITGISRGVSEFSYFSELTKMIKSILNGRGIDAYTTNRMAGSGTDFEPPYIKNQSARWLTPEIRLVRDIATKKFPGRVRCAINFHFNWTGNDSGFLFFNPTSEISHYRYTSWLINKITKSLKNIGLPHDSDRQQNLYTFSGPRNVNGEGYLLSPLFNGIPQCGFTLLELFNDVNVNDVKFAFTKKAEIAQAIADGIEAYVKGEEPEYTEEERQREMVIASAALADTSKIAERFPTDDKKVLAVETQNDLTDIETHLQGGTAVKCSTGNEVEIIGTKPVPFNSTRAISKGAYYTVPMVRGGGIVKKQIPYTVYENVDVTGRIPFGKKQIFSHTLYEINSYELNLFSGGHIRLRGGGNMEITASKQVDVTSGNNIFITSGNFLGLNAANTNIDSDVSITKSLAVDGGILSSSSIYANGGMASTSFNGPATIDKTNLQELYGYLIQDVKFSLKQGNIGLLLLNLTGTAEGTFNGIPGTFTFTGSTLVCQPGGDICITNVDSGEGEGGKAALKVPPHRHYFKRLNGSLADNSVELQNSIASNFAK